MSRALFFYLSLFYDINFVLQIENDEAETITLANGSLSGLMVYPKVILNKGWGNFLLNVTLPFFILTWLSAECIMADKIVQVEEFCTHSKILGKYQIRSDKHKLLKVNWMFSSNFLIDDFLKSYSSYSKGCVAFFWLIVVEIDKKIRFHKILGLEYMMKMKKYTNTEYLVS